MMLLCLQDDVSNPDMPFAVGFTLERLTAQTVDENGQAAFVTNNPMELLRKVVSLPELLHMMRRLQMPAVQASMHYATLALFLTDCHAVQPSCRQWLSMLPQHASYAGGWPACIHHHGHSCCQQHSPPDCMQASELRRLALYFDVSAELWRTEVDWKDMQPGQWDALFLPSIKAPEEGQEAPAHTYVLRPLDGQTTYLRRGPKARSSLDEPVQQADVGLDAVSIHLSSAHPALYCCCTYICMSMGRMHPCRAAICTGYAQSAGPLWSLS